MDLLWQLLIGIRIVLERHSAQVWLLWSLALLLLAATPLALFDPAAWVFVADPELAALVALLGLAGLRAGALRVTWHPLLTLARRAQR